MNLSEDDAKVLIHLLEQLSFKPKDARVVNKIIDKLQGAVKQPDLKPTEKPKGEAKTDVIAEEPQIV